MTTPLSYVYNKSNPPHHKGDYRIEITRIYGVWPRKVFLQWVVKKPTFATGYKYNVYRSGGSEGPWTKLTDDLEDTYLFVDDTFPAPTDRTQPGLFSIQRSIYYKVTVDHTTDGTAETIKNLEAGLDQRRAGIIRKLRRDVVVMLRKGEGTEVAVFKRRWAGEKCTCQTSTGMTTRSHCEKCLGTGIITGYWKPVYTYAKRSTAPVVTQIGSPGTIETRFLKVIMPDIPEVTALDILVFLRDNKRYTIDQVNTTEIHTVTAHQELSVSELSHAAVEFDLTADKWHRPEWF